MKTFESIPFSGCTDSFWTIVFERTKIIILKERIKNKEYIYVEVLETSKNKMFDKFQVSSMRTKSRKNFFAGTSYTCAFKAN